MLRPRSWPGQPDSNQTASGKPGAVHFLIHDEFADWMLDDAYKAAGGAAVQRLGV